MIIGSGRTAYDIASYADVCGLVTMLMVFLCGCEYEPHDWPFFFYLNDLSESRMLMNRFRIDSKTFCLQFATSAL